MIWERIDLSHETGTPGSLSFSEIAAVLFCAGFLTVQITLPLVQLWEPRPSRFGWQMFAAVPDPQVYTVTTQRGPVVPISLFTRASNWRADIRPRGNEFADYLCRTVPGALSVRYQMTYRERIHKCPRR